MQAQETEAPGGAEGEDRHGRSRRRVRERLLAPMAAAGMRKPKGVSAADHEAMLARIVDRLAWMTAEGLDALAAAVEEAADGQNRNLWPAEATVVNIARRIERPPADADRLVTSYMRSAAGREAWARGPEHALALLRYLREFGAPRTDAALDRIGRDAREVRRAMDKARRAEGPEAAEAAAEWGRAVDRVEALVFPRDDEVAV